MGASYSVLLAFGNDFELVIRLSKELETVLRAQINLRISGWSNNNNSNDHDQDQERGLNDMIRQSQRFFRHATIQDMRELVTCK
jgi:hypothetical protein